MKNKILKHKDEIKLFTLVSIFYLTLALMFYNKTTIFYDTYGTYNVLLDTDTGVLFNWNTFAIAQDNSKHLLFSQFVSILTYPIFILSQNLQAKGIPFNNAYGIGLIIAQILVSATSITLLYNYIKSLNIKKTTLSLITGLIIFSFPQIFMTLNIERFIYAQLSLVAFIFLIDKIRDKKSYLLDLAAIPLFGITLTNIYLYFINLLLEFKLNIKKMLKHIGLFVLASYIIIISTKAYNSFLLISDVIQTDTKFILSVSIIDKIKMILIRLIYPTMYFPTHEIINNKMQQQGPVNILFFIIMMIAFVLAILGGIKNIKERIPQLCLSIIGFNIFLHGIVGYNLVSANIMTIHFSFAIILLLAHLSTKLDKQKTKTFNTFLTILLITVIFSNINGFIEILNLGTKIYPK